MILDLFFISVTIVALIDLTDINITYKKVIAYLFNKKDYNAVKVNLCSLCINWWCSLFYLLITNQISLPSIMTAALFSVFTIQICSILRFMQDLINIIINKMYEIIE